MIHSAGQRGSRLRNLSRRLFIGALPLSVSAAAAVPGFNVKDHNASGDGVHSDTRAIQSAIDACSKSGGGTVFFPAGTYLSGTIVLKSHVTLHLDPGAVLLGSKDLSDYPQHVPAIRSYTDTYTDKSLVYSEDADNIAITGRGTIDGQGASFRGPYKVRPYLMRFINCRNVLMDGVTIKDSPMWVQHYLACDDVTIHGITVHSRVNGNNDGIDIDGCRRVRISDSDIWCGDDAIVLKATLDRATEDVVVTNCVLSTLCNALKLGTESNGGFENIAISNCTIYDTRLAGIAIEMVDGGALDRVSVSNITMNGVGAPIFVRLGDRGRPFVSGGARPPAGTMRNVSISNIEADGCGDTGCAIAGLPGHPIEGVAIENVRLTFVGGGTRAEARRAISEESAAYPEFKMFGKLPAYGFYCRHVKGLRLENVRTGFTRADDRPALVCDGVTGLHLAGSSFDTTAAADSAIRLVDSSEALIQGCRASGPAGTWLRVEGPASRRISIIGNDLANARHAVEAAAGVSKDSIFLSANRANKE
jgi:polygalacturonase